jgi:phage-related holin
MNEKIRQLAEQADAYAHLTGEGMMYQKTRERYTEKFAELIAKECIGILEPKSRYMGEGPEVLKDKIRQIKKHFGVEE